MQFKCKCLLLATNVCSLLSVANKPLAQLKTASLLKPKVFRKCIQQAETAYKETEAVL